MCKYIQLTTLGISNRVSAFLPYYIERTKPEFMFLIPLIQNHCSNITYLLFVNFVILLVKYVYLLLMKLINYVKTSNCGTSGDDGLSHLMRQGPFLNISNMALIFIAVVPNAII